MSLEEPRLTYYQLEVVVQRTGLSPARIRRIESAGLLGPDRVPGTRRGYGETEMARLRKIRRLTDDLGVNLAGVEVILRMTERMALMEAQMREIQAQMLAEIRRLRQALGEPLDAEVVSHVTLERSAETPRETQ